MSNTERPTHKAPQAAADAHREAIFRVMAYHVGPRAAQAILDRGASAASKEGGQPANVVQSQPGADVELAATAGVEVAHTEISARR
jgi:hypothetical protein